jgi:hypothetical protein
MTWAGLLAMVECSAELGNMLDLGELAAAGDDSGGDIFEVMPWARVELMRSKCRPARMPRATGEDALALDDPGPRPRPGRAHRGRR